MAAVNERAIPTEETFHLLREKAKAEGDAFTVKVWRKSHIGGVPELQATLSGASIEHFNSPELWIPQLCGGGLLSMQGYHPTDLAKAIGGILQLKISQEAKAIDPSVVTKPEWRGPPVLDFPQKEAVREREQTSIYGIGSPTAPGNGEQRHQNNQADNPGKRWEVRSPDYGSETPWQEQRRLQQALELEKRKLDEERLANERQKHKDELIAQAKSHEADLRALKAELMGAIQLNKPTGPDASVTFFQTLMQMQQENAKQAAEDRREREKLAAEERKEDRARQERSDERFNKLMEKISERPKEDPLAMIEKVSNIMGKNNSNDAQMKMMSNMAEMHSVQMGSAMDFIQAAADMQLGGREKEESPIIKGIEAAVKGVAAFAKGAQAKRPPQQFAQPQLPQTYEQQARTPQPPRPPAPPAAQKMPSILEQIEIGIKSKAPIAGPDGVAKAIVNHIKEESMLAALTEVNFDFEVLVNNRLGIWANEHVDNAAYLKALTAEVEKELKLAGYIQGDDDEAPEGMVEDTQTDDDGDENEE